MEGKKWTKDNHDLVNDIWKADKKNEHTERQVVWTKQGGEISQKKGMCGDDLSWTLDGHVLTITGEGPMWDWDHESWDSKGWADWSREIESVIMPPTLTKIGVGAFFYCLNLTNVFINEDEIKGSSLKKIGKYAFARCIHLREMVIPESVTEIGDYAFGECFALNKIIIPENTSLGAMLFWYDQALQSIKLPQNMKDLPTGLFHGCRSLSQIQIPCGVKEVLDYAFYECVSLNKVIIPQNVEKIYNHAFDGCENLQTIVFEGKAPEFSSDFDSPGTNDKQQQFKNVCATAYYHQDDQTWTRDVRRNYGGDIKWVPI